jgi:nuclear pore complex protein Nup107
LETEQSLRALIEGHWLIRCRSSFDPQFVRDSRELRELDLLREMYIPEILFQLHTVLYVTREHMVNHRQRSLQLCQLVVDERFQCYRELMKCGKLVNLLDLFRNSSLAMLEVNRSPFATSSLPLSSSSSTSSP